jgi:quercetin dioxygenase-like cupin family protein
MATQSTTRPFGQDPARVDSKHYTVELEDEKIRVLRARYGPHEKSAMHSHPALVAIMLTDFNIRMTYADGKTEVMTGKAGQTVKFPDTEHLPENLSGQVFEAILVEMKA